MNEAYVRKAALQALTSANQVLGMAELEPVPTEALGEEIKRAGNAIRLEAQVPDEPVEPEPPDDPPWEPEPPPPDDPPPLGGEPVIPDLPPFTKTIEKNGGACVVVNGDGQHYENLRVRYGQWMGFSIAKQDPTNGVLGFMLDACQLETGWAGDFKGWGVRGYDMAQFHYRNTNFLCAMAIAQNIEHGNYQNIYGGGLLEDCFWLGFPGQASQYVWSGRQTESANFTGLSGKDVAGDVVRYVNCQMHNCGSWISGRGSFALSMFHGQVGLVLENHLIQKMNEPKVHGALLFQGNGKRQSLHILNSRFYWRGVPDREQSQVYQAKDALVDGGEFWTTPGHELKGFRFMDCGPVEFRGSPKGNVEVWIGKAGVWHTKTTLAKVGAGTIL